MPSAPQCGFGEDVEEDVEKVIITNYDSIVGLEFDAVFLLGCDEAIKVGHKAEVQSVWVALSRPRQFQHISHVGTVKVFGEPAFDAFRFAMRLRKKCTRTELERELFGGDLKCE